jgi:polysaccharide biosynthesis transport protein
MDSPTPQPPPETKLDFLDYWRIIRIRKTVILAVFLLVVITATVVTALLQPTYQSVAKIEVHRDMSDISGSLQLGSQVLGGSSYDPYFIQNESEVIQSEAILTNVIYDLDPSTKTDLNNKWGKKYNGGRPFDTQETLKFLRHSLDIVPKRNTQIIEIRVSSSFGGTDPDKSKAEARDIANKIADSYRAYRQNLRKRLSEEGIKALEKSLAELDQKVTTAQSNVDRLRVELKVSDYSSAGDAPSTQLPAETLRRWESLRIEGRTEYEREKTRLERLRALDPVSRAHAILSSGILDPGVQLLSTLLEQKTLVDQKFVEVSSLYGPSHVEVIKVSRQVEDLDNKIKERVSGIVNGFETKVAAAEEALGKLQAATEEAEKRDLDKQKESVPYFEAKRGLTHLLASRGALELRILQERIELALPKQSMVQVIEPAELALKPYRPSWGLNMALGVIVGLVVGVGLAFFIEYLDTSVKTIDDVERRMGAPVLGIIPQNVGILVDEGAESSHAEAYRVLRTNLLFSRKDEKLNTVAVVSAGAGEGKSTTVFNLASVFAQSGQRVLMVDSDLRRPTLHKMLRVTNSIGLTNYLLKQNSLEEVIQTTSLPTLDFMASGKLPSSSLGILNSNQMRDLITELKQHYDFIFFDSPPLMGVSDATILASEVDMTVQVMQYRRYPQPMILRAKQLVEKVGGNLVGIVLNNINVSQDQSYYYYYYSGYYHDNEQQSEEAEPAAPAEGRSGDKDKLDIKPKY